MSGPAGALGAAADALRQRVMAAGRALTDQAIAEKFLGSPTFQIDGADIEPSARQRTDFGMSCRRYPTADGPSGLPERRMLETLMDAH